MKTMEEIHLYHRTRIPLALLALIIAIAPSAFAKHRNSTPAEQPVSVIAHLALPGAPASQIILQQQDGRQYLYLVRNSRKGFTIVDVTHPNQPNLVKRVAWPDGASAGQLQLVSGTLALAEGSEARSAAARAETPTESLELLDLSDPANPRTIQKFSGVTSVVTDDSRNLVYVTNSDGLWVLKHQPERVALRPCTSSDASAAMPSCQ